MSRFQPFRSLIGERETSGVVQSVSDFTVTVSTPRGPVTVSRQNDGTRYRVGDRVMVSGGRVVGRLGEVRRVVV